MIESNEVSTIALQRAKLGLRAVTAELPHLGGLARIVRIRASSRVSVAAISATGLILINPELFATLEMANVVYILAHEMLHIALDTFSRGEGSDALAVNLAHDAVINDILTNELGREPPLNGVNVPGARTSSLEALLAQARNSADQGHESWNNPKWHSSKRPAAKSDMAIALEKAGLLAPDSSADSGSQASQGSSVGQGDLISPELEREFEPQQTIEKQKLKRTEIRRAGTVAVG